MFINHKMNLDFIMKKRQQQLKIHFLYNKNRKTRIANTFHHNWYSENIKDGSRLGRGVGGRVTGGLVLHHVLHGRGHHRCVDEREVGSDPDLIELLDFFFLISLSDNVNVAMK